MKKFEQAAIEAGGSRQELWQLAGALAVGRSFGSTQELANSSLRLEAIAALPQSVRKASGFPIARSRELRLSL